MVTRLIIVMFMLALASGPTWGDEKKPVKEELKKLQGEWVMVSVEPATKKDGEQSQRVVVTGDEWKTTRTPRAFTVRVDNSKSPKHLDLVSDNKGKERTWRGIYKIEGDKLTFCRANAAGTGVQRPTEFKAGPGVELMVFKRAEK
jgi:uncharacterized protein (TIGR03067 family)